MAENNLKLFGFEIRRSKDSEKLQPSPVTPSLEDGAINIQSGAHYGLYVDLDGSYRSGVELAPDSVVYVTSGLFDPGKSTVLSYCHKAIRPMNQLRFIEDAVVVYT